METTCTNVTLTTGPRRLSPSLGGLGRGPGRAQGIREPCLHRFALPRLAAASFCMASMMRGRPLNTGMPDGESRGGFHLPAAAGRWQPFGGRPAGLVTQRTWLESPDPV